MASKPSEQAFWQRRPVRFAVILFGLILSYVGWALVLGLPLLEDETERLLPFQTGFWAAIMTAIMCAVGFSTHHSASIERNGLWKKVPIDGDWQGLADHVRAERKVPARQRMGRAMVVGGAVSGLVFAGVGITFSIGIADMVEAFKFSSWFILVLPVVFANFSRGAYWSILTDRIVLDWVVARLHVDLLDAGPLKPFAKMALANSLRWVIILTFSILILLGADIRFLLMLPLIGGGLFVSIVAFVLPMRGVHARLVEEKQTALTRLNGQIEQARIAMEAGDDKQAARIQGLIAYRGLIFEAREWPYDVGTLARLTLYLAIPVGGWVGGALVEQIIDAVL